MNGLFPFSFPDGSLSLSDNGTDIRTQKPMLQKGHNQVKRGVLNCRVMVVDICRISHCLNTLYARVGSSVSKTYFEGAKEKMGGIENKATLIEIKRQTSLK